MSLPCFCIESCLAHNHDLCANLVHSCFNLLPRFLHVALSCTVAHVFISFAAYRLHVLQVQVWGPKAPKDMQQYRRRESEKSKWGGHKEDDMSVVIGIWLPADGWQIYAQTIRRQKGKGRQTSYVVVDVWKLWPTAYDQPPFKL